MRTKKRALFKMATRSGSPARKRTKTSEAQQKRNPSRSAKKRRSSFVRGRKERKSLVPPGKLMGDELYKEIPPDLPQESRLRKLFDSCVQVALDKLDNERGFDVPNIPNFKDEAKEAFRTLKSIILDSELIDETFKTPKQEVQLVPNRKNIEMEESYAAITAIIDKLEGEVEKWDELLAAAKEEEEAESARKASQELNNNISEECPDFLSPDDHVLLSGKLSLKSLFKKQHDLQQRITLQIQNVCKVTHKLSEYKDSSQAFIETQLGEFSSKTLANEVVTPRRLIRGQLKNL